MSSRRRSIIFLVAAAAFLLKIWLAAATYGTNDVYGFHHFYEWSLYLGVGLYRADRYFNHPPSMIHVLRLVGWLSRATPVPFQFWFRLPSILADTGSLSIVWKLLQPRTEDNSVFWSLVLFAAAPASILISGFHGNSDPILVFFLLLTVYLTEKGSYILGGAAFGLAMSVKVVPIELIPAIFLYLPGRKRIRFFGPAAAVILTTWSPFLFEDPAAIWHNVIGYRSQYGVWGLSFLAGQLAWLTPELEPCRAWFDAAFREYGRYLALGLATVLAVWMNRPGRAGPRPRLFSQVGITMFLFLSVSNGFGMQYLAWLLPWVTELGLFPAALFYTTSGCFLFSVYNYWSQGVPRYVADSNQVGHYNGHADYVQLLCWSSVVTVLYVAWKRIADRMAARPAAPPLTRPVLALRCAGAILIASSLRAMTPPQQAGTPHPRENAADISVIYAESDLQLLAIRAARSRIQ